VTRYRITHRTAYAYSDEVSLSYGRGHLQPRTLPWQRCVASEVAVDPAPSDRSVRPDAYGNASVYFSVTQPHTALTVTGTSEVEVADPPVDEAALALDWRAARPGAAGDPLAVEFALASPQVVLTPDVHDYAAVSLRPGRPFGEAVADLRTRIHQDCTYRPGATTVTSSVPDVLARRAGVCQDFAHLAVACLRSHGLAARYVSGYLATDPPPGRPRVVGADASHAWVSVRVPGPGSGPDRWLAFDPTNDQLAGDRYTTVAWGRDYGDVPPLRGVLFSDAERSSMTVSVDVAPL
jgi:transglutaminase-like putative cysteine protease